MAIPASRKTYWVPSLQANKHNSHHNSTVAFGKHSKRRFTCKVNPYWETKISVPLSQFEEFGLKFFPGEYS